MTTVAKREQSPGEAPLCPTGPLRFHWSLSQAGDTFRRSVVTTAMSGELRLDAQLALCRRAEECGVESMLMAVGFTRPDPTLLSLVLGQRTESVKFMVACRPGLLSPTSFVQQINTLSTLIGGRVSLNVVSGHTPHEQGRYGDFLSHDERYRRADEFLTVCRAFWAGQDEVNFSGRYYQIENGRLGTPFAGEASGPEIYLGGSSLQAVELAERHASCLWRLAEAPEVLGPKISSLLHSGTEVGLLVALIARSTRQEALESATGLIARFGAESREAQRKFAERSDSEGFRAAYELGAGAESDWVSHCLWAGAVPYLGAPAVALVGSADEVAEALMEYKRLGVSQFLFTGWPDIEEMTLFHREVLPRVRERESACLL